jgi:hypothetical protein
MTLEDLDTDLLSLDRCNHPPLCARIRLPRQNGLMLETTVAIVEKD